MNINPAYDAPEFREAWFSKRPLREIAADYNTTIHNVWRAATCRGWPPRRVINPPKKALKA